jgi:hypothetical protein
MVHRGCPLPAVQGGTKSLLLLLRLLFSTGHRTPLLLCRWLVPPMYLLLRMLQQRDRLSQRGAVHDLS